MEEVLIAMWFFCLREEEAGGSYSKSYLSNFLGSLQQGNVPVNQYKNR
ncbi:hypothetical protein [Odoribacter sp. AF15-53]|nr:hypothetical protein [Odoribacter sp. AF15-53]